MQTITPGEAFHPGEYLRDELDERGWTVTEFAEIIGRPVQAVSEILNGKKEITTETAIEVGQALGTSPEMWLNLQMQYRLFLQRQRASDADILTPVQRRARLRELVPLAEIRKRGWLGAGDGLDELEAATCRFLAIPDINATPNFAAAARRANATEPLSVEQRAWLARVRELAGVQQVAPFDPDELATQAAALPHSLRTGPAALVDVPARLAECGVGVVFLEGLRGGKIDGVATFLDNGTAAIGLTTRYDRFDSLMFTLLHECAHLALGHISSESVAIVDEDLDPDSPQVDPQETEANTQATRWMFPNGFELPSSTSVAAMVTASARYGVHSSVIIGQVQRRLDRFDLHRTKIPKVRPTLHEAGLLA
jgi:HTH-type transcriptional regulator/antitoxin HigA